MDLRKQDLEGVGFTREMAGYENDPDMMLVNPEHCPNVKAETGQKFVDWITGPQGQEAIASYQINGEQLFFPNATGPS